MLERMAFTIGFALFILLSSSNGCVISDSSTAGLLHCICISEIAPVCGSDGRLYPNDCLLDCHKMFMRTNIEIMNAEFCKDDDCNGRCSMKIDPVCGTNGKTYRNMCSLQCAMDENFSLELHAKGQCLPEIALARRSMYDTLFDFRSPRKEELSVQN